MKDANVIKNTGNNVVAGETPFHSLLQKSVSKDTVIQRSGAGESICYIDGASSSDDD